MGENEVAQELANICRRKTGKQSRAMERAREGANKAKLLRPYLAFEL